MKRSYIVTAFIVLVASVSIFWIAIPKLFNTASTAAVGLAGLLAVFSLLSVILLVNEVFLKTKEKKNDS